MTAGVWHEQVRGEGRPGWRGRRIVSARAASLFCEPGIRAADAWAAVMHAVRENHVGVAVVIENHSEILEQVAVARFAEGSVRCGTTQTVQADRMIVNAGRDEVL